MSIELNILEKRLSNIENALMFLSDSLGAAFPGVGVAFSSISDGVLEVHKEIETYKSDKVRAKRNGLFEREIMIDHDDLNFLVKTFARALAESPTCDRVTKESSHGGGLNGAKEAYRIDLSNLSLQEFENGISNTDLWSHQFTLFAVIEYGIKTTVRETVTIDMETVTYTTGYDPKNHPLVKDRLIAWFYQQVEQHLGSSAWCLPGPDRDEKKGSSLTLYPLKIRPVDPILEELKKVSTRLLMWMVRHRVTHYGVALKEPSSQNSRSTAVQTIARRSELTEEPVIHLWDHDPDKFASPKKDINFIFAVEDPVDGDGYQDFVKVVESLSLRRLARLYSLLKGIQFFEPTVESSTVTGYDGTRYAVEFIEGDKVDIQE